MANMEERPETLSDHLHAQLANEELSEAVHAAADRIIYNLDYNGYLPLPLAELIDPEGSAGQLEQLEQALQVVQAMDPP